MFIEEAGKMRNYFTHLKEASRQRKPYCLIRRTKSTEKLLQKFLSLGLIHSIGRQGRDFLVGLKYREERGCLDDLKFYKPNRFFYRPYSVHRWIGRSPYYSETWLISTDRGIFTHHECFQRGIGGSIICSFVL